jgi:hypothetical protein
MCGRTINAYSCGDDIEMTFHWCPLRRHTTQPCDEIDLAVWRLVKDEPCRWCKKAQSNLKPAKSLNIEQEMQSERSQQKDMNSETEREVKQLMEPERKVEVESDVEMEMDWEIKSRVRGQSANESKSHPFVDSSK